MTTKTNLAFIATTMLCATAFGQNEISDTTKQAMPIEQDDPVIPEYMHKPVPSMVPNTSYCLDTLNTSDPAIQLVLYSDNTWKYIKNGEYFNTDRYFTDDWNDRTDAYGLELSDLPDRTTIWLVDSPTDFCCPNKTKVFSPFGIRHRRRHQGVDLPLKTGDPVYAAFGGKVRISEYSGGYGNVVVIRHNNGLETTYGHLSRRDVQVNDWVSAGDVIGLGGSTGHSTGPHLHFETRYKGYAFDPQWLCDFESGTLRSGVFVLKKRYLSAASKYVPESQDEEEEILLAEEQEREEAERKAAEEAAKKYHRVKSGDTLTALAVKYHTSVRQICAWNGIKQTSILRLGQTLRVH